MRLLSVVLGLSVATSAYAQSQADDDEKPGQRTQTNRQAPTQTGDETAVPAAPNTQPPPETSGPAPADTLSDTPAMPAQHSAVENDTGEVRSRGDSPIQLDGSRRRMHGDVMQSAHAEGAYSGVSLDGQGTPPKGQKPMKGPQRLTWPGFQVKDGIPTVFLQTTGVPDYAVAQTPGALTVTLHGTTIKLRNNSRPLKVEAFGTDVSEVSAKPHGKDVVVTIRRTGQAHRERVEQSPGGFQLLVVELPQEQK